MAKAALTLDSAQRARTGNEVAFMMFLEPVAAAYLERSALTQAGKGLTRLRLQGAPVPV